MAAAALRTRTRVPPSALRPLSSARTRHRPAPARAPAAQRHRTGRSRTFRLRRAAPGDRRLRSAARRAVRRLRPPAHRRQYFGRRGADERCRRLARRPPPRGGRPCALAAKWHRGRRRSDRRLVRARVGHRHRADAGGDGHGRDRRRARSAPERLSKPGLARDDGPARPRSRSPARSRSLYPARTLRRRRQLHPDRRLAGHHQGPRVQLHAAAITRLRRRIGGR